jgi:predicted RNA-binding Zn-ribbon protein involved in translation (DUF1610 family)
MEKTTETEKAVVFDFELFEKVFGMKINNVGLTCPKCGNSFGFRIHKERSISEVNPIKLTCYNCKNKGNEEAKNVIK